MITIKKITQSLVLPMFIFTGLNAQSFNENNLSSLSKIDTTKTGSYKISYKSIDSYGNEVIKTRIVNVINNEAPVIVLNGLSEITIYQDSSYTESGFTATDKEDGDITSNVQVIGYVNTSVVGKYTKTYKVTDSFGNSSEITRTINILPASDIRVKEISKSDLSSNYEFNLWDYMVNKSDSSVLVQKFKNEIKLENQLNKLELVSSNELSIELPYTLRTLNYVDNGDNTININFEKEDEIVKTIKLNKKVKKGESISLSTGERACKIVEHYNEIELSSNVYEDVIKMTCELDNGDTKEAYFEKDKGLFLENTKENSIETESIMGAQSVSDRDDLNSEISIPSIKVQFQSQNFESVKKVNADKLFTSEYNLSGDGVKVGIIDGGKIRTSHVEFDDSKINNLTTSSYSSHANHVAGTISAKGIKEKAKGFASNVELYVNTYNSYSFGTSMKRLYEDHSVLISNHSYGIMSSNYQGTYTYSAGLLDRYVYENPYLIGVKSAGNNRGDTGYSDYGNIKSAGNAKNVITVGAVDSNNEITYFSSTGPVKNGRIKPDIVSKGSRIYSVDKDNDTDYRYMSGTSMAAPAVTGTLALMQEQYKKVNNENMKENIAKGILVNTAKDLGRVGPDYEYGYGLVNAYESVKVIDTMNTEDSLVKEETIIKGEKHKYTLEITEDTEFKATLSWIDPTISYGQEELSTDLDITIEDESGEVVYAYTLNPDSPEEVAVQDKLNTVDNVEQIKHDLTIGTYTITVQSSKMTKSNSQEYALISNITLGDHTVVSNYLEIKEFETTIYNTYN